MKKISQIMCALTLSTAAMSMEHQEDQSSSLTRSPRSEVADSDILNDPVSFKISYVCPKMKEMPYGYGVSSIVVRLPNNQILTTGPWTPSNNPGGTRYFLRAGDSYVSDFTLSKEDCPFQMEVYLMTGYIDENKLETSEAIPVCIKKEDLTQQLQAVRITHGSDNVKNMHLTFRYQ